jgi:hypothetical protein
MDENVDLKLPEESSKKLIFTKKDNQSQLDWENSLEWQSLSLICNRVKCMRNVHDEMAKKLYRWAFLMLFFAAFITFLASIFSFLSNRSETCETEDHVDITVACLTSLSTVLQVLGATLNWRGRAEEHNKAYREYLRLYFELVAALKGVLRTDMKGNASQYIVLVREKINSIESSVSTPPDSKLMIHWRDYYSQTNWKERMQKRKIDFEIRMKDYRSELES